MKMHRLSIAATAVAVSTLAGVAWAQKPAPKAPTAPKQTTCAVLGTKLGDHGKPISVAYTGKNKAYTGKTVLVCCGGCTDAVKKDPDKYFAKVYAPKKK